MLLSVIQATISTAGANGSTEFATAAESWAKIIAILVAGLWTYLLFVRQRQRYPRATAIQSAIARDLDDKRRVLTVRVALTNIGQRLIQVDYVTVVVQQLAPLRPVSIESAIASHNPLDAAGRREILWYRIAHRRTGFETHHLEIEPGEAEEIDFDFVIARSVSTIKVQTHIENVLKRDSPRDWLRRLLAGSTRISVRSANRCLGWQCTTYHSLPTSAGAFTKLTDIIKSEDGDVGQEKVGPSARV